MEKRSFPMINNNLPEKFPNFVLFKTADGKVNIDVYFYNETLWLSQKLIAELFQKDRSVISKHLKNIFEEGELNEQVVCAKFALTTQHKNIGSKISVLEAKIKAEAEYDKFRVIQDRNYISDFDKEIKKLIGKNEGDSNNDI